MDIDWENLSWSKLIELHDKYHACTDSINHQRALNEIFRRSELGDNQAVQFLGE